jgi:hypothetical protein
MVDVYHAAQPKFVNLTAPYSLVEAESHKAAAAAFKNHPHLQIPQSSIQVMEIRSIGQM